MIICLAVQIFREVVLLAEEPPLWKSGTTSLEKWRSLRKKVSLTPQKVEMRSPKKSLSPIPSENVLFAKKRIKIGKIWPLQLHFWSTGAYRGSPPYAIFPIPDTEKYSIVLCYFLPCHVGMDPPFFFGLQNRCFKRITESNLDDYFVVDDDGGCDPSMETPWRLMQIFQGQLRPKKNQKFCSSWSTPRLPSKLCPLKS